MSLRELRRYGGYLQQGGVNGTWCHHYEGERAKCPYPGCGRTWMIVAGSKVVSTRVPRDDGDPSVIGQIKCQSSACGKPFEVGVADPKTTRQLQGM